MESHRNWYQRQPQFSSFMRKPAHPIQRQPSPNVFPDPFSRSSSSQGEPARPIQRQPGPKVVRIPVHFVGSEPVDRSGSALRIQKAFRGFLVRKNVRRIRDVKRQVDEIEEKLLTKEVVELIRSTEKERLRLSENLMSLLFKLDSIRGVDLGVRVFRKAVTRKAIALQENIDSILTVDLGEAGEDAEIEGQEPEVRVYEETEMSNQLDNSVRMDDCDGISEGFHEILVDSEEKLEDVNNNDDTETIVDVGVDRVLEVCRENCTDEKVMIEKDGMQKICEENCTEEEILIENDGTEKVDNWIEVEDEGKMKDGNRDEKNDSKRNNELMEQMMEENEKMMKMMSQLFESNEKQMKMLTALSHRVEMLEKVFLCDMQRRKTKKKKKSPGCGVE